MTREFKELNITDIVVKGRIRENDGDIATLATSIEKLGLLSPIIVDRNNVLISGGRRLAACRRAGLARVPVAQVDITYDSMLALDIQVDKNLCRKALSERELNRLIQSKKTAAAPATAGQGRILGGLKRLFARA